MNGPFRIYDCALIVRMGGVREAMNLRELRDRITACSLDCLYHHFCETPLRPSFDDPEFRNDFAVWASRDLHDRPLAERLGVLDPYRFDDLEALRTEVLDLLDDHLSEIPHVPTARRGQEFHFMRAVTVLFDTGNEIREPSQLTDAIAGMTRSSLYYHFVEARRRTVDHVDDFSTWLRGSDDGAAHHLAATFSAFDFYFLALPELQRDLIFMAKEILRRGAAP